ncbi:MAG: hypothetical protein N4A74_04295 [Carboxylicivirga sp.]|jgi:hypothetical protein|nr:hypothetical protein [Carboxylicivirga sp.]
MKPLFLIALIYFAAHAEAQESSLPEKDTIQVIPVSRNRHSDQRLIKWLDVKKAYILLYCHPKLNSIEIDGHVLDSTHQVELLSEKVEIHLKDSYSWEIGTDLPDAPSIKLIKSLIKKKEKVTEDEKKLHRFMAFYERRNVEYIDKFVCRQEIKLNDKNRYKIAYELIFTDNHKIRIKHQAVEKLRIR